MDHYILSFTAYTMAMIGIILLALFIFKACLGIGTSGKNSNLKVIDSMKLSPKKTLYVIKAEGEKYLIAADVDSTSLIAKLEETKPVSKFNTISENVKRREDKSSTLPSFDGVSSLKEFSKTIDFEERKTAKRPVMRELAMKLQER